MYLDDEIMKAILLEDKSIVTVKHIEKLIWQDINTYEYYIIHDDIELLY